MLKSLNRSKALLTAACLFGLCGSAAFAGTTTTAVTSLPDGVVGAPYSVDLTTALTSSNSYYFSNLDTWTVALGPVAPGEFYHSQRLDAGRRDIERHSDQRRAF